MLRWFFVATHALSFTYNMWFSRLEMVAFNWLTKLQSQRYFLIYQMHLLNFQIKISQIFGWIYTQYSAGKGHSYCWPVYCTNVAATRELWSNVKSACKYTLCLLKLCSQIICFDIESFITALGWCSPKRCSGDSHMDSWTLPVVCM